MEATILIKGIGIFVCMIAVVTIVGMIKSKTLQLVEYHITSHKIKQSIGMVVLADLHNKEHGARNQKLLDKIRELRPDCIVIAGDMMIARDCTKIQDLQVPISLLKELVSICPVYYGNGNHEHNIKDRMATNDLYLQYIQILTHEGVTVLENDSIVLGEWGMTITGLDLPRSFYKRGRRKDMAEDVVKGYVGRASEETCQILIAHNPEYYEQYHKWGADITVSGHIHGGIVRVPVIGGLISPSLCLFPKYDGGMHEIEDSRLVVSRGLGMHTIPVRLFNPPELVSIIIHKE